MAYPLEVLRLFIEVADRLVVIIRVKVGHAAGEIVCGIVGLQLDRLVVFADRFVVILFLIEVPTTAIVEGRI